MKPHAHEVLLCGRQTGKTARINTRAVEEWNRLCPVGTPVFLTDDDGEEHLTETRSEAWMAGSHALVSVVGRSGGYSLRRVRPVDGRLVWLTDRETL